MHHAQRFHRDDLLKPDLVSEFVLVAAGLLFMAVVALLFLRAAQ